MPRSFWTCVAVAGNVLSGVEVATMIRSTSAASIPLALDEAFQEGRVNRGDVLLMSGFGAGLTWGTGLFRW